MKSFLLLLLLISFQANVIFGNKNIISANKNMQIKLSLAFNKLVYSQNDDEVLFNISVVNNSNIPKIFKYYCVSLNNKIKYMFILKITHDNSEYMLKYPEGRCLELSYKLLTKRQPLFISERIYFKNLVNKNAEHSNKELNNLNYGIYSVQAQYCFAKDTLFSNIVNIYYVDSL